MEEQQNTEPVGEVQETTGAPETAAHAGASAMIEGIDGLVQDLEKFLDSVPVTAFHDRDADKVARAREKATSLKDEVLIIKKMIEDAKSAIEGVQDGGERFASKFASSSVRKVLEAYSQVL